MNISTASIVLGLLVAYYNLKPPVVIIQLTNQLANLAAPLDMFYIGVLIMSLYRKKVHDPSQKIWIPIAVKLIILPACVALMMNYVNLILEIIQTVLIQSMMPTLTLASILIAKYSADEDMGAFTTVLSTIFALITIPLMVYLIF
ncbi:AEC family transporter [Bacillus salipaludis]|uniref:AEC family transporter n=1 Tax=Bacillus salipaludis TaxID=2547811 RepID=A0ABW8RNZ4_9BACI